MSFTAGQKVKVTVRTVQAGEVIGSDEYPATVQVQKGKWVTLELEAPLPSSNGSFLATRMIAKETDVMLVVGE